MARRKQPKRPARSSGDPLSRAHKLWQTGRFDEALKAFAGAVREAPNDPRVLIEVSRAYGQRYQIDRSLALLEKGLRHGRRQYAIQHAVGESYRLLGRLDQAEACFQRACGLVAHPQSQLELAAIYERTHRLDEADELARKVVAKEPNSGPAKILLARIARRRGEVDRADTLLRTITSTHGFPSVVVAEAWGELATLLDKTAEYDAAWDAAMRCKELLLPLSETEWKVASHVLGRCKRMAEALTREHFQKWTTPNNLSEQRRLALLTGFPRSGTTLLEQVLDAHPEVESTEEKDLFASVLFPKLGSDHPNDAPIEKVLDGLSENQIRSARDFYLRAVEAMQGKPLDELLHVDKNPSMTLMIPAMLRVFPELKTIVSLRDPRDVVLSCFLRYLPVNPVSVCFLTLERTVERFLLDMGAWVKMRGLLADNWVEVRYEDLVGDLEQTARSVLSELELPWNDRILNYQSKTSKKAVLSPTYEAVAQPIFSSAIGRWKNYERQLAPALDRLVPILAPLGYED